MCTRSLPALKASRGPCLEGFLLGLQPGTVEHGSTSQRGPGVGLQKHSQTLLGGSPEGPIDASLGSQALVQAVPGCSLGQAAPTPSSAPSSAPTGAGFGVRPWSNTGFGGAARAQCVRRRGRQREHPQVPTAAGGTQQSLPQLLTAPQVPPPPALAHGSSEVSGGTRSPAISPWPPGTSPPAQSRAHLPSTAAAGRRVDPGSAWLSSPSLAPTAPLVPQEPESARGKPQVCLQITRLKDILIAESFYSSAAFRAFTVPPCPSSGFEPLKALPRKRLTGEGAPRMLRSPLGPGISLAASGQERNGGVPAPPQHGAGVGCRGVVQGCPASRSSRRHPSSAWQCLPWVRACWHQGTGGYGWHERGEKGWSERWGQGVP